MLKRHRCWAEAGARNASVPCHHRHETTCGGAALAEAIDGVASQAEKASQRNESRAKPV